MEGKTVTAPIKYRPVCRECRKPFLVIYPQTDPDEPLQHVPVPCPWCGGVTRVPVGSGAARAAQLRIETWKPAA
jgi:hypothetical protein